MHYLEKSPGMCSDRPGTTPKGLDLVVFPTCLREKERDTFGVCVRFGGEVKGTSNISQVWPTPRFCPVADCPRSFGGPSAFEIFTLQLTETASAQTCADRPRSFGGLSAMNFCG